MAARFPFNADDSAICFSVYDLKCEGLVNPIGTDNPKPRLSWKLSCTDPQKRGLRQSACHILVATSVENLHPDRADLWNSGRYESEATNDVAYGGKPLASGQRVFWTVRAWDEGQVPTPWATPGSWTMGVLSPSEWRAHWIGAKHEPERPTMHGAHWIWIDDEENAEAVVFERAFTLSKVPERALLLAGASDRYDAEINGTQVEKEPEGNYDPWRHMGKYEITSLLQAGKNRIAVHAGSAAKPGGVIAKLIVDSETVFSTDADWRATHAGSASRRAEVRDVGPYGCEPWGEIDPNGPEPTPAPMLRKRFNVAKGLTSATAYVCGIGYGVFSINGRRPDDRVWDPPFTNYDKRVLYTTYDVTGLLEEGPNTAAMVLGNGFLNVPAYDAWNFEKAPWRQIPVARIQIHLKYANGASEWLITDESWKAGHGPWLWDAVRQGEKYDARLEVSNWDTVAFDDSEWAHAYVAKGPRGRMAAFTGTPCRVTETLKPVSLKEPKPGVFVFDLGQNIAGWARIRPKVPAGTQIRLRFAEKLLPDGTIDQSNINGLVYDPFFAEVRYTAKGKNDEWESAFAYYGFQYVQVEGWTGKPSLNDLDGRVVHSDFKRIGDVKSLPFFNRLQEHTDWSYRSNFVGIPTDCPHREKNGWTGDAHLATEQALFNYDNVPNYRKWLDDLVDEQQADGSLPGIVPTGGWGYSWGNGPAWDSALVLIPWYLYLYTGELSVLERYYGAMRKYVKYLVANADHDQIVFGLGDWVPAKTVTPEVVTSTAYYAVDLEVLSLAATLLGKSADAMEFGYLSRKVRYAFQANFVSPDGVVMNGSQTAQSCALFQRMVKTSRHQPVLQKLLDAIDANDGKLDVGILGAKYLFETLSENEHHELAVQMLTRKDFPSYGWWMEQGATTLWETWDGEASRNHIMFGDVSAWMMKQLAGLRPDPQKPGFKRFTLTPRVGCGIPKVEAYHESPHGRIESNWSLVGDMFRWQVVVPPNTTALVGIPTSQHEGVTESGVSLKQAPGVRIRSMKDGRVFVELRSGTYDFRSPVCAEGSETS